MTSKEALIEKIHNCTPWEPGLESSLAVFGFQEPSKSWKDFISLANFTDFKKLYPNFFSNLLDLSARSHNADLGLHNLERFVENFKEKEHLFTQLSESKHLLESLVYLFSGSQILTDSLLSEPSHLNWLSEPEILNESKSKDILMRDFYEMAGEKFHKNETSKFLRKFKKREILK